MSGEINFIEFSKPFIDATKNIFETMVFTKIEAQKPSIKADSIAKGDITAMIGLTGEVNKNGAIHNYKAMLVVSYPYETYFKIASSMLGEIYTSYVPEIFDLGGEIVNIVMGNAKRELMNLGYTTNMAIPSIVEGKNISIMYPAGTNIVLIPFSSPIGDFYMELCYTEEQ